MTRYGLTPKPPRRRLRLVFAAVALLSIAATSALLWRKDDQEPGSFRGIPAGDPGAGHVHGLGVNPADGTLFIATHYGLFEAKPDAPEATRVGKRFQDTMGFTVVGPNRFLGSGHPDLTEAREKGLPPLLGLIASTDAGRTWKPISLQGEADFHVLRFAGNRVYGYDATNDRLLASANRGRSWDELKQPGPIVDLAVHPTEGRRIVVSAAWGLNEGLYESRNGGESWNRVGNVTGLLGWPSPDRLYLVTPGGQVLGSEDGGRRFRRLGEIGGEPAAFLAERSDDLYVAIHTGAIKRSTDGGHRWSFRATP